MRIKAIMFAVFSVAVFFSGAPLRAENPVKGGQDKFNLAVECIKRHEGWHSVKNHPYVGWGHCLQPGENYSARTMTKQQADALLRKDLRKFCVMFRQFGKDSLLLSES